MMKRSLREAHMLPDFIRLVDYMSVGRLVGLNETANEALLAEMTRQPRKVGMFETSVYFDADDAVVVAKVSHNYVV